jgi:aspartate-semialdehyde dehydrogenase
VEVLRNESFDGVDVALFSAGASRSREFAPEAVRRGAVVVDNSSAFRLERGVPLVVPEVNPEALRRHRGLVANPNCSTIIMLVPLAPLYAAAGLRRIVVATYQSVSGAGATARFQLGEETRAHLRQGQGAWGRGRGGPPTWKPITHHLSPITVLPAQIAFNVIPQVDVFMDGRVTREELKMVHETRKILGEPNLPVSAMCVRVPVFVAHSEAIWIETERPLSVERARTLLRKSPGVKLVDEPASGRYPLPVEAAGQDDVLVGRLRKDDSVKHGLALWVSGDNLRKGAATNAVQIAELLIERRRP